tara:strand:- start:2473 stop:2961 length:489 start_codon:yes stop_codon:yes gene_type:complete
MGWINNSPSKRYAMNWAEPNLAKVEIIARNLRRQDELEVFYSHGVTGVEAVMESWENSNICRCIDGDNGMPVGLCGVNDSLIWLLGTDDLLSTSSHRRQFIKGGKRWVNELINEGNTFLHNWALASNSTTFRWLKHLGFTIDEPIPLGEDGKLFCHFWRKNK